MFSSDGIIEINVHDMNAFQAQTAIDAALRRAGKGTYRLRIVHGYRGGTVLRDMVRSRYRTHTKVIRVEIGLNAGATDLVLREY